MRQNNLDFTIGWPINYKAKTFSSVAFFLFLRVDVRAQTERS